MTHYEYLIIGGGMTAASAVEGIRLVDKTRTVGMITKESVPPYKRPPLTKGLWKGKPLEKIWRNLTHHQVEIHLGRTAVSLDATTKQVEDDQGNKYSYNKLLLATGGFPRKLPFGGDQIIYFRSLDDYERLRGLAVPGSRFAIIGGGFIGSEIAAALKMNGQDVVMVFPEEGISARVFPTDLAKYINEYYRQRGVDVLAGEMIAGVEPRLGKLALITLSGKEVLVDHIVAGIGILPDIALAKEAGIETGDGIIVDEYLRTSLPDIYAAGDVASFYNPALGHRLRVEHEDNANIMGETAGLNIAGQATPYHHLPYFYSDLFDLGYEAVGELNPALETVVDWQDPCQKGVIYYLKDGRVRGVLLWNVWDQIPAARELIAGQGPFEAADLHGRLPRA